MTAKEDHPRRCGENSPIRLASYSPTGSPPQVRGKHFGREAGATGVRITPAGAGKTKSFLRLYMLWQDHPRRCGENPKVGVATTTTTGSPPQVRGKLAIIKSSISPIRITPAGAGKTSVFRTRMGRQSDHPRRCGENRNGEGAVVRYTGSPPQVRGKLCA